MKSVSPLLDLIEMKVPKNESQLMRGCRVGLRYLGEGCFRAAFEIIDYPLIVKVPLTNCYSDLHHANEEWNWIDKVQSETKYKALRKYMPKVYYFDEECGLMVMRRYKIEASYTKDVEALDKLVKSVTGATGHDVGSWNVGRDTKGNLKIVDTALLGQMSDD